MKQIPKYSKQELSKNSELCSEKGKIIVLSDKRDHLSHFCSQEKQWSKWQQQQ